MFNFEEICELIRLVGSTHVGCVEIERAGNRIRVEGASRGAAAAAPVLPSASGEAAVVETPSPSAASLPHRDPAGAAADDSGDNVHYVTSPIVGTFYRAPNPDADPYVRSGDFVEKGQVLCIVEAMKLMNEIECDVSGTIVNVLPENSDPVEFGENLFAVRPR